MTSAFSDYTLRQLHRAGFVESASYLSNCLEIRDEFGGYFGHMTEREAREKLLGIREEEVTAIE